MIQGYIEDVNNDRVYGRFRDPDGEEWDFDMSIFDVMDSQRVHMEIGSYIYFINGYLYVYNVMWTTHDIEEANKQAKLWYNALWGDIDERSSITTAVTSIR